MLANKRLVSLVLLFTIATQFSLGTAKKLKRPKELTLGMPPPHNVMNGGEKIEHEKPTTGGDAPQEAEGKEELIDKQPSGQNTTESGEPPRYPINVESTEAQAHESRITGCRDHPDVAKVCTKARDPCFCAEHESYTYSYCRKSCRFCNPKMKSYHKYWRLRAGSSFNPSWMISNVEFYRTRGLNQTLSNDPSSAYSSSNYEPGFSAAKAFDDDSSSMWMPDGWDDHNDNSDWIAYEFTIPVHIGSIKLDGAIKYPKAAPSKIFVESADEKYGPFETKWMIRNPDFATMKVFSFIECDVLWRRYETGEEPICIRLIAKYKNWMDAQKECQMEGGELASITSKEEYDFILQEVKLCGFTWIGLNDRQQEGNYIWSDNASSNFTRWKSNQAYDEVQRHYEDCVAMDPDGNWFTFSCQNKFYFLCKKTLVDPPDPIPQEPPIPETPEIQFIAPNYTTPVVGAEEKSEEENLSEEDKYKEALASIAMSRMKELGLKPPEAVANLEVPPPDLSEQLHNLTEIALKSPHRKKPSSESSDPNKLIDSPPGRKRPVMQTNGKKPSPSKSKGLTILKVPTSPGQELIDEIPGVPGLRIPGEEGDEEDSDKDSGKDEKKKGNKGQKVKPPPAQEGQDDEELSVGESGDEGPAEGQGEAQDMELPKKQPKPVGIKPKKKKPKKPASPDNNAPQYPPQLKTPPLPKQPSVPPKNPKPSLNNLGKKHDVASKKKQPFSITFAGKQVMNVQQKHAVNQAAEHEAEAEEAPEQNFTEKEESAESEELENAESQSETEKPETEVEESGSQSGSGLGGFDPDLEEDFLDLDVDDLLL